MTPLDSDDDSVPDETDEPASSGTDGAGATALIPAWTDDGLRPVDKLDVHRRGLRHKAVSVFVRSGDRILLQKRAAGKYHTPGLWANACCTHPRWAETPDDCVRRRLDEELGIRGLEPVHRGRVEYRAEVGGGLVEHEVVEIYLAEAPPDLALAPDPEEVAETRWTTLPDLQEEISRQPSAFVPWLRIYLAEHAEAILGGKSCE